MSYPIALPPESPGEDPERIAVARPAIGTAEFGAPVRKYPSAVPAFVQPKLLLYGQLQQYGVIRSESALRAVRRSALAAVVRRELPTNTGMDLFASCTAALDSLTAQRPTVRAFVQGLLHPVFQEDGYLESSSTETAAATSAARADILSRRSALGALVEHPEIAAQVESLASDIGRIGAERAVYAALDVGVHCASNTDAGSRLPTRTPSVHHTELDLRDRLERAAAAVRTAAPLERSEDERVAVRRLSREITLPVDGQRPAPSVNLDKPIGAGVLDPSTRRSTGNHAGHIGSHPLLGRVLHEGFQTGGYGGLVYHLPRTPEGDRGWLVNPWWAARSISCPYEGNWDYEQLWERTWLFERLSAGLLARVPQPGTVDQLECPFCRLGHPCGKQACQSDTVLGSLNRQLHGCVQQLAAELPDSSRARRESDSSHG